MVSESAPSKARGIGQVVVHKKSGGHLRTAEMAEVITDAHRDWQSELRVSEWLALRF